MKTSLKIFAIIVCGILAFSCANSGQTPEQVAELYATAMFQQDYTTMKTLAAPTKAEEIAKIEQEVADRELTLEKQELLTQYSKYEKKAQPAEISGDKETAVVIVIFLDNGQPIEGMMSQMKYSLQKVNGQWKITDDNQW
ncbi:hypothetical protein FACS1894201_01910 [Bacteroidia bacterium]|nr:hypothetical protein FACS1894201_01910 [Bacteroidia bacterium]